MADEDPIMEKARQLAAKELRDAKSFQLVSPIPSVWQLRSERNLSHRDATRDLQLRVRKTDTGAELRTLLKSMGDRDGPKEAIVLTRQLMSYQTGGQAVFRVVLENHPTEIGQGAGHVRAVHPLKGASQGNKKPEKAIQRLKTEMKKLGLDTSSFRFHRMTMEPLMSSESSEAAYEVPELQQNCIDTLLNLQKEFGQVYTLEGLKEALYELKVDMRIVFEIGEFGPKAPVRVEAMVKDVTARPLTGKLLIRAKGRIYSPSS